ncbi:MAG: hypothetical protein ACJ8M4_07025 [Chthoniobacterales bacterium]
MADIFALRTLRRLLLLSLIGSFVSCLALGAEKDQPPPEKAPFDPKKAEDAGVGMPTPYDKFLALDQALTATKVNWGQVYRKVAVDIDADAFTDKEVAIPMVLGIRIADGVMAIKALDAEMLNKCAADIEKLAKKLDISDAELGRARAVRAAANKGEWLKVFMELGFFQQDIMKKIETKEHSNRGTLLIVCGWIQGARYTTTVVADNYSPTVSNILREPLLARALKDKVEALPGPIKETPSLAKLREAMPKIETILTIPLNGTISKENVGELNRLATEIVQGALAPSTAPAASK